MNSYGERLAEALRISGKERQHLADAMNVSVQAIGQVILGNTKALTAENTAYAAKYLGVDYYWLATGKGEPSKNSAIAETATSENASPEWPFSMSLQEILEIGPDEKASLDKYISYTVKEWRLSQIEGNAKKRKPDQQAY